MIAAITLVPWVAAPRPASDPAALSLLRQVEAKTHRLKGFSCDLVAVRTYAAAKSGGAPYHGEDRLHVVFAHPNRFAIDAEEQGMRFRAISDGTHLFFVSKDAYAKSDIDTKAQSFHWYHDDLLKLLVTGSFAEAVEAPSPPALTMLPSETWEGKTYRVIGAKVEGGYPIAYRLYVGSDLLVHRIVHEEVNYGQTLAIESSAPTIVPNPSTAAGTFAFAPASLKERSGEIPRRPGEFPLIKVGATATDFSLPTPGGPRLSLAEAMKGSRAVLLNFWFVHCPPCRAEHPHLQKFYEEMRTKGLAVVGVDDQDTAAQSVAYLKGARLTFPVVLTGPRFRTDPKTGQTEYGGPSMPDYASLAPYGVGSCPTNILIDAATGKVVYCAGEWDETGLRQALKTLGVE